MISKKQVDEAFVWIWIAGEIQPVVAGKLEGVTTWGRTNVSD